MTMSKQEETEKFNSDKLELLAEFEGFEDSLALLQAFAIDSVVPGICKSPDCDYATDTEPDSDSGWCEICDTGSVVSCMVLANII